MILMKLLFWYQWFLSFWVNTHLFAQTGQIMGNLKESTQNSEFCSAQNRQKNSSKKKSSSFWAGLSD